MQKGHANTCCIIRSSDLCWDGILWSLMGEEEETKFLDKYVAVK